MYIEKEQEFIPECELKEHVILRGFYQTNSAPELYVSKQGRIWSEIRETFIKTKPSKYGYPCFNSLEKTYLIHVLLAETFIRKPESNRKLEVNHRDGNKNNFDLKNLEWVTRKENIQHAVQTGLISKNLYTLLSKDFVTDEIVEHRSLNECARYLKCQASTLSLYLRRVPTSLLKRRFDVIYKGGRWNSFTKADIGRPGLGQRRSIIAFHQETNTATIYGSASEASKHTGIERTEISTRASGRRSPHVKGYRFIWLDEYKGTTEGIPVVSETSAHERTNPTLRRPEKPIRVTYSDGTSEILSGSSLLAKKYSVQKSTILSAIRKNECFKDIRITYL